MLGSPQTAPNRGLSQLGICERKLLLDKQRIPYAARATSLLRTLLSFAAFITKPLSLAFVN